MTRPLLIVVDDEPQIGAFVREVAEAIGFEVSVAASAKAFRSLAAERGPDAIVTDLVMPDEDGIELLQSLAAQRCRAAIIVMSGYPYLPAATTIATRKGLRVLGALAKPARLAELQALLRQALPPPVPE